MEINTFTQFTIGGKTYNSVEQMPPDVRTQFEEIQRSLVDNNHNGMLDIAEGDGSGVTVIEHNNVSINSSPIDQSILASKGKLSAKHTLDLMAGGRVDEQLQLSRGTLLKLMAGVALFAALVVWLLKI
ncbi:MAG: hypothetical protein L0H70_00580 [Xanthomonadales bacterium]|nr:hypothetical protein [Xanthomonadales bacterium]